MREIQVWSWTGAWTSPSLVGAASSQALAYNERVWAQAGAWVVKPKERSNLA